MSIAFKSGLALLLVAGITTGCAPSPAPAPAAAPTPEEVLAASVPAADAAPFAYTIAGLDTDGITQDLRGTASPASRSYDMATSFRQADPEFTMNLDLRVIDTSSWVRVVFEAGEGVEGLPSLPEKWLAVDPAKAGTGDDAMPTAFTPADADPGATGALFATIIDATSADPGSYAGSMDLTRSAAADIIDVAQAGDTARSVPFTATVDGEGRLTALAVEVPAIGTVPAFTYRVTYAYGTARPVSAPAPADTAKTPDALYELLA